MKNLIQVKKIKSLYKKVKEGKANYEEAQKFAQETGRILSQAFQNNLSSNELPNGKLYYNIANRVIDDISYMLDEPIVNFSQSVVDDTVKTNAEFQYKSGLNPKIKRTSKNNCCEWCNKLAGEYNYEETKGIDVYRRHTNCNCLVEFIPGNGKKQNVHTKKWSRELKKEIIPIESKKVKEYNKYPVEILKRKYKNSVDSGMISALCTFENYYNLYVEIEERIIGKHTGNGILIKSQSKHFLERVIGTGVDPEIYKKNHKKVHRDGVEINDICDALFNGNPRPCKRTSRGNSQVFEGKKCKALMNPDNGNLIQCNPRRERNGKV